MKKIVLLAAAVAMLAAMAVPAYASADGDVGVFTGTATVGSTGCYPSTGQGLGLPVVHGVKTGKWSLETAVLGAVHGAGNLAACGDLAPVADNVFAVGAACGMSKGHSGSGTLTGGGGLSAALTNLGWKATAGGTIPVVGNYSGHGAGTVLAAVQAQGGVPCASDAANSFQVVGASALVPVGGVDDNLPVVTCKDSNDSACLYGDK